jgi:protein involved in polysaccharide export with SLBB domain
MEQYAQFRGDTAFGQATYRIAVGTRLAVQVVSQGIDRQVYVGPDGKIDLPLVGTVKAAGKNIDNLRDELKERFKPYFRGDFQVNINTDRPEFVSSDGRLFLAGRATIVIADQGLRGNLAELQGDECLAEVLFGSGWGGGTSLGEKPEWKEVGVIREVAFDDPDRPNETIVILCDLERLLFAGDVRQNVPIRHRDIVFVPRRRDTLIEELHDSLGYWAGMLSDTEDIRDVVKAMEGW